MGAAGASAAQIEATLRAHLADIDFYAALDTLAYVRTGGGVRRRLAPRPEGLTRSHRPPGRARSRLHVLDGCLCCGLGLGL